MIPRMLRPGKAEMLIAFLSSSMQARYAVVALAEAAAFVFSKRSEYEKRVILSIKTT